MFSMKFMYIESPCFMLNACAIINMFPQFTTNVEITHLEFFKPFY